MKLEFVVNPPEEVTWGHVFEARMKEADRIVASYMSGFRNVMTDQRESMAVRANRENGRS